MKKYNVNLYAEDEIIIKKTLKKEKAMKNKSQKTNKSKKNKQMDLSGDDECVV